VTNEELRARQLDAFTEIVDKPMISEQVFAQTMFKSLPTSNHTFTFRKQFCAQLALSSLFSYLFNCAACMPNKLLFAKGSGLVFQQDVAARYSASDREARAKLQEVPYRCGCPLARLWVARASLGRQMQCCAVVLSRGEGVLSHNHCAGVSRQVRGKGQVHDGEGCCRFTRNFHMFVTPFGVEGWFLVAQVICAQAMLQPKQEMKWVFSLFFRCASYWNLSRLAVAFAARLLSCQPAGRLFVCAVFRQTGCMCQRLPLAPPQCLCICGLVWFGSGTAELSRLCGYRDDITAQPTNRRTLRQRAKLPEELERALQQLGQLMNVHLEDMMERVRGISGSSNQPAYDAAPCAHTDGGSIDKSRTLIHAATAAKLLCMQDPSFHPWF
jgi:hypothetical protein